MSVVLITGGSGFIGTNLVEHLQSIGHAVVSADSAPPRLRHHTQVWRRVDVLDKTAVHELFALVRPTHVVHCAARTDLDRSARLDGYRSNYLGVANVVEAIEATGSVQSSVFLSTQLVCPIDSPPERDRDYRPTTLYGTSKAMGEEIVRAADGGRAPWTILRPTSVWGPWFDLPYRNMFEAIADGRYVHVGNHDAEKLWSYVGNATYQLERLLFCTQLADIHRKTFTLADASPIHLREFAIAVAREFGGRPPRTVPYPVLSAAAKVGDVIAKAGIDAVPLTSFRLHNIVTDELPRLSPLAPVVGDLPYTVEDGIKATVEWLRSQRRPTGAHLTS